MNNILARLFEKRKIEAADTLSPEEAETFRKWEAILSTEDVTVERLRAFCLQQKAFIESAWDDLNNSIQKNERLILQHTIYNKLLSVMDAPQKEREQLEGYLQGLIDAP